jgi:hypothetical protein
MNRRNLLRRLSQGALHNVRFQDMKSRYHGLHTQEAPPGLRDRIYEAPYSPYQIRQFLRIIERHDLELED